MDFTSVLTYADSKVAWRLNEFRCGWLYAIEKKEKINLAFE